MYGTPDIHQCNGVIRVLSLIIFPGISFNFAVLFLQRVYSPHGRHSGLSCYIVIIGNVAASRLLSLRSGNFKAGIGWATFISMRAYFIGFISHARRPCCFLNEISTIIFYNSCRLLFLRCLHSCTRRLTVHLYDGSTVYAIYTVCYFLYSALHAPVSPTLATSAPLPLPTFRSEIFRRCQGSFCFSNYMLVSLLDTCSLFGLAACVSVRLLRNFQDSQERE